jgi:hypothetical protein
MTKFLVLYISDKPLEEQPKASPEDMKKAAEPWMAWFKRQGAAVVDPGNATGKPWGIDKKGKAKTHTDKVTGYTIVEAKNRESVIAMLGDNPHLSMPKTSIEILETMPMM